MKKNLLVILLGVTSLFTQAQNSLNLRDQSFTPPKGVSLPSDFQGYSLNNQPGSPRIFPMMVQFEHALSQKEKENFQSLGITFDRAYEGHIWSVLWSRASGKSTQTLLDQGAKAIFLMPEALKKDPRLNDPTQCAWAHNNGQYHVVISFPKNFDIKSILTFPVSWKAVHMTHGYAELTCTLNVMNELVKHPAILGIEPIHPPFSTDNLPGRTSHQAQILSNPTGRNLDGTGIRVGEWDGGAVGNHLDYDDRKTIIDSQYLHQHAAHVAGTILGSGSINYYAKGMAPNAKLYSADFYGDIPVEMDSAQRRYQMHLTNNSYGYSPSFDPCPKGNYDIESEKMDQLSRNYPTLLHVFSAGNSQTACTGGWRTIGSGYNSAKNVLTVGAVDYKGAMSSFSSWGPVRDGRVKPEISSVGVNVYSTQFDHLYAGGWNGTSMAAPGVTGSLALIYQRYEQLYSGQYPSSSLVKALVCNNALDAGNIKVDYKFGYGNIQALEAVRAMEQNRFGMDTISQGDTLFIPVSISKTVHEMRWMITWTDPEAASGSTSTLINDVDLLVKTPSGSFIQPWVLDPANPNNNAARQTDTTNNIEQVTLDAAVPGTYTLIIIGKDISVGPQWVAYTWSAMDTTLELGYPEGGEVFNHGDSRTLRWHSIAPAGTFTLSYSTDAGATYTTIASGVSATQRHFDWTVPTVTTDQARIKITDGVRTDSSDLFSIMAWPSGLTAYACSGKVSLTWNAVSGVNGYEIYRYENNKWTWIDSSSTNSYMDTMVTNGKTYWYSIKSKLSSGATSEFAYAARGTPQSQFVNIISSNKSDRLNCGDSITLTGPSGASAYAWSTGQTTSSIKIYTPQTVTLEVTWPGGCKAYSSAFVIKPSLEAVLEEDTICPGGMAKMKAFNTEGNGLRFTEISQFRDGTGATSPLPSWIGGGSNNDFVEVTNMGTDSVRLGEVTFELWSDTLLRKYTWASSLKLPAGKISLLHVGSSVTNDTSRFYFNTGGTDNPSGSADPRGYILRWQNRILDAVGVNGYQFPSKSGVTFSDWNGSIPSMSGRAGTRLALNDFNNAGQWALSNAGNLLNLGNPNSGLQQNKTASFSWTGPNGFNASAAVATDSFPSVSGQYHAISTAGACQYDIPLWLEIYQAPIPMVTNGGHCGNGKPNAKATGIGLIRWYSDSTGGTLLQTGDSVFQQNTQTNTIWWVSLDDGRCESKRVKLQEMSLTPAYVNISKKISGTIANPILTLSAQSVNSGYTYKWSAGVGITLSDSIGSKTIANPSNNGVVTLMAYDSSTFCSYSTQIQVSAYNLPVSQINAANDTICLGDSTLLYADSLKGLGWTSHKLRIQYDASKGRGRLDTAGVVYLYAGRVDTNLVGTIWKDSIGTWGAADSVGIMTYLGNNLWEIEMSVADYFNITTDSNLSWIAFKFRNQDGTAAGLDTAGNEIFIDLRDSVLLSSYQDGVKASWIQYYQWYEGTQAASQASSLWAKNAGTYSLVTYGLGGSDSSTFTLTVIQMQKGIISVSSDTICLGDSANVWVSGSSNVTDWEYSNSGQWVSLGKSDTIQSIQPTQNTWYRAKLTASPCSDDYSDSVLIVVKPLPNAGQIQVSDTLVCPGDSIMAVLSAYQGTIDQWYWFDSIAQSWSSLGTNLDTIYYVVQNAGNLKVAVSSQGCGPAYANSLSISTYENPGFPKLSSIKDSLCAGDSTWAYVGGQFYQGAQLIWEKYDSTSQAFTGTGFTGDSAYIGNGVYRVIEKSPYCSLQSISDTLIILPRQKIVWGGIRSTINPVCQGDSTLLSVSVSGQDTLQWYFLDYNQQIWFAANQSTTQWYNTPTDSITYRVVAWNGCGSDTSPIFTQYISMPPSPGAIILSRDTICKNDTVMAVATGYTGFLSWEKDTGNGYFDLGVTSDTLIVSGNQSFRLRMRVQNSGCRAVYSSGNIVQVRPDADAGSILFVQDTICIGDTLAMGVYNNVGSEFIWEANSGSGWTVVDTGVAIEMPILTNTVFRVIALNYGCGSDTSVYDTAVAISAPLTGTITGPSAGVCQGANTWISTAGFAGNLSWFIYDSAQSNWSPLNRFGDSVLISLNASSWIGLRAENGYCLPAFDSLFINVQPTSNIDSLILSADSICPGSAVRIKGAGIVGTADWYRFDSMSMNWVSLGIAADSILVNPTQEERYMAVVQNGACGVDSAMVAVHMRANAPVPGSIQASATSACIGSSVTLTLVGHQGNITWQEFDSTTLTWVNRGGTGTNAAVFPYGNTRYRARITRNGCVAFASEIVIGTLPTPLANITANGPLTFCEGKNVTLQAATGTGYQYQWQKDSVNIPGAVNATLLVTQAGRYRVLVSISGNCQVSSSFVTVVVNPAPAVPIITRVGNDLSSSATTGNQWFVNGVPVAGGTSQTITPTQKGSYTVRVTGANNCSSTSLAFVWTSTDKPKINPVTIYPNPAHTWLFIEGTFELPMIWDMQGKWMNLPWQRTDKGIKIDLSSVAEGMYLIRIGDETFKVVKATN